MIKAVIFDCFGVLIGDAYMVLRKEYPQLDSEIVELGVQSSLGIMTSEERKERTIELLNGVGADGKKVLGDAVDGIKRNTKLLDEIKILRKNVRIGLLSNVGEGFWKRFTEKEVKEYFDDIVLSYQVGLAKPDKRIFELAAKRFAVLSEECIFVDDDKANVMSAEKCGMAGIVYEWGMDIVGALKTYGVEAK